MDPEVITCPAFLSLQKSMIDDFVDCTKESHAEAEACIRALNHSVDEDQINRLFRALHSFKGNCQMVGLTPFVTPLHHVEDIVARLRSKQLVYHPKVGEFVLLASAEMIELLVQLVETGCADAPRSMRICNASTTALSQVRPDNVAEQFQLAIAHIAPQRANAQTETRHHRVTLDLPNDMTFMHALSARLDALSIYRTNRSDQVVKLSAELNEALGFPADPEQLKAAALMHDIGMSLIPHNIFNKEGQLSKEELRKLQEHVISGSLLVMRFGGWEDAARMILDHHERFDGSGYPNGIAGDEISPGGHILSIIDTFCAITTERSDRAYKKSLLSAISEINANSDTQFNPVMVKAFTGVFRKLMLSGG